MCGSARHSATSLLFKPRIRLPGFGARQEGKACGFDLQERAAGLRGQLQDCVVSCAMCPRVRPICEALGGSWELSELWHWFVGCLRLLPRGHLGHRSRPRLSSADSQERRFPVPVPDSCRFIIPNIYRRGFHIYSAQTLLSCKLTAI